MDLEKLAAEFDRAAERHPGYVTAFNFGKGERSEGGGIHFGGIDKAAMLDLATLWRKAQPHLPEARVNPQTHDDGALDWLEARGRWDAELNYAEQREVNPFREIATCLRLEVKDNGKPPADGKPTTRIVEITKKELAAVLEISGGTLSKRIYDTKEIRLHGEHGTRAKLIKLDVNQFAEPQRKAILARCGLDT